jgi:hypothetical protein
LGQRDACSLARVRLNGFTFLGRQILALSSRDCHSFFGAGTCIRRRYSCVMDRERGATAG